MEVKTAVIYTRVSTDEQADKGYSLRDQEDRLTEFCERENISIAAHFQDSHTGRTFDRPGFNQLMSFCHKNKGKINFLYTTKVDRLGRNALLALSTVAQLKELGIQFQSIEQKLDYSSPESYLMQVLYHTLPDIENQRRAKNIESGMRRAQKEGRYFGRTPIGYSREHDHKGKPIYIPGKDAEIIQSLFQEVIKTDGANLNELRKALELKGIVIIKTNIYKMLRNPFYMGKILVKAYDNEPEELVEGIHEGLITPELYYKVQEVLFGKKKNISKSVTLAENQFQKGFLICKRCGRLLMSSTSRGRHGGKYSYYHCISSCGERIRAEKVNSAFVDELKKIIIQPEVLELFEQILVERLGENSIDNKKKQILIEKQVTDIEKQLLEIDEAYHLTKKMSEDSYYRLTGSLKKKLSMLFAQKYDLSIAENFKELPRLDNNILSNLPFFFNEANVEIKREIEGSIFSEKLIFDSESFRTPKRNSVIELLINDSNVFNVEDKKKVARKSDLSPRVHPGGLEPPT